MLIVPSLDADWTLVIMPLSLLEVVELGDSSSIITFFTDTGSFSCYSSMGTTIFGMIVLFFLAGTGFRWISSPLSGMTKLSSLDKIGLISTTGEFFNIVLFLGWFFGVISTYLRIGSFFVISWELSIGILSVSCASGLIELLVLTMLYF